MKNKYCKIKIDKKGKKKPDFGKTWGAMKKEDANTSFIQTGNGLFVIDIDFKNIKKAPKHIRTFIKSLGVPTVETARGYHFYIKSKAPMTNHQNIFDDKKWGVDIRGEGGLVFNDYWGKDKNVSYVKTGKTIKDKKFKIFKSLPQDVREPRAKKTSNIERGDVGEKSKRDIKHLLSKVSITDYTDRDSWISMLAAVYHGGGDKVEKIARKWCKGDKDNYDDESFDNTWSQLQKGKYGTEISVGTLIDAAGMTKPPEDVFGDASEQLKTMKKAKSKLTKEEKKKAKKFDGLHTGLGMNDDTVEAMKNQTHLIEGVLVSGMHTVLYGRAGSMKTTLAGWMMVEILKKFKDKQVQFWSFDASTNHNASIYQYMKDAEVDDRFELIVGETSQAHSTFYDQAIKYGADLSNLVVVNDTLKFLTKDVNSKNAMKDYMHYMKQLQSLGATILTLSHSNKDGVKESGTAELEQDSDALLRVDRETTTGENLSNIVTTTLKAAGRTRFHCEGVVYKSAPIGKDYEYLYSALQTMTATDDKVDAEVVEKIEVKKLSKQDIQLNIELSELIDDLNNGRGKHISAKENMIANEMKANAHITSTKVSSLLREGMDILWTYKQKRLNKGDKKKVKVYRLL